jgi:hypothetical protein
MRQLRYYRCGGVIPAEGYREFGSQAEAAEYRAQQASLWQKFDWDQFTHV